MVYPGIIPLDSDLLAVNRNTMIAIGYLVRSILGDGTTVDGLACLPTSPASMTVGVGPGSISQLATIDPLPYGSLSARGSEPLIKMGVNTTPTTFALTAPTTSGQTINYLIQATFQESDADPVVLPYYNAADPTQPYSGPSNSGMPQHTSRLQQVQLQLKPGVPAAAGTQVTPAVDAGWVGLYVASVAYGQTSVTSAHISVHPTAPFLGWKLPTLRPGVASGSQSFTASGTFVVPFGVSQVEVELWGGGAGSFASQPGLPSGGAAAGGYARRRVTGLSAGQTIAVTIGGGGAAGTVAGAQPVSGGTTSFGSFVSATGGALNGIANSSAPYHGGTPPGVGVGGDVNLMGSTGQAGVSNQGGLGGAAPMGGAQNSGTSGNGGIFPGGGASGAGTGADSATRYNGAAGAAGFMIVRW